MAKTITVMNLYRDDKGKLRKTKSGHYRFDLITTNEDGSPHSSVLGYRLDYERRRILPITTPRGSSLYIIAEIAPEEHGPMVTRLCKAIEDEKEEERIRSNGGY